MNAPEVEHPERAEHRFARKAVGAMRGHPVTSNQEATDPLVDVIVDRASLERLLREHPFFNGLPGPLEQVIVGEAHVGVFVVEHATPPP
jgi:hypothetical protein